MCSLNIVVTWFNADAWDASLTSMGRAIFIIDLRSFRFANSKFSNISTTIATASNKMSTQIPERNVSHTFAPYSQVIVSYYYCYYLKDLCFFLSFVPLLFLFSVTRIHSFPLELLGFFFCCTSKQIILCKTLFVTLVLTITHKYNWKCAREQNIANMKWTKKHTHTTHTRQLTWRQLRVTRIQRSEINFYKCVYIHIYRKSAIHIVVNTRNTVKTRKQELINHQRPHLKGNTIPTMIFIEAVSPTRHSSIYDTHF